MKKISIRAMLLAMAMGLAGCGGAESTGTEGPGSTNGPGTSEGDPTTTTIVPPAQVDASKVIDEFVKTMDVLAKEMNAVTVATCSTSSSKASVDVLRAFVRKLLADHVLKAMESEFLGVAASAMDMLGMVGIISELQSASPLTGYLVKVIKVLLGNLLGGNLFDPVCVSGQPRWEVKYEGGPFAKTNLVTEDLIVKREQGSITFKVNPAKLCAATFNQGSQPIWKELEPVCTEMLTNGKPYTTVTLSNSNELGVDIKLSEGKIPLISILINPERTRYTIDFDFSRAKDIVNAVGYGKFFGEGSSFGGRLGIELSLAGSSGHDGVATSISIKQPIVLSPVIMNNGKRRVSLSVSISGGQSETGATVVAGIEKSGKLYASEVALGKVLIGIKPEPDPNMKIGPIELELTSASGSAEAFGKPLSTKVTNWTMGTLYLKSNGTPACTIDVNKSAGGKVSASIREASGGYSITYTPGLNIQANCKPVPGMLPAGMDPLFKNYNFTMPSGESSLNAESTFLLDMAAGIISAM